METNDKKNRECCLPFDPVPWDDQISEWENKLFLLDKVSTLLYIPLNFSGVMKKLDAMVRGAGANFSGEMCLCDHVSKWKMNILLGVDKEIPGAEHITLSGRFFSKVYEGPFGQTGKWHQDFAARLKDKGFNAKKIFTWYTTCPKCAKKYGKNYVAMLAWLT